MSKNFAKYNWSDFIENVAIQPPFLNVNITIQYETKLEMRMRKELCKCCIFVKI